MACCQLGIELEFISAALRRPRAGSAGSLSNSGGVGRLGPDSDLDLSWNRDQAAGPRAAPRSVRRLLRPGAPSQPDSESESEAQWPLSKLRLGPGSKSVQDSRPRPGPEAARRAQSEGPSLRLGHCQDRDHCSIESKSLSRAPASRPSPPSHTTPREAYQVVSRAAPVSRKSD